jgi:hypothetical protein
MAVDLHPHAQERIKERGASEDEVIITVEKGERFPVRFGRTGFRHNFPFNDKWHGKYYKTKQVEVYAVQEKGSDWLALTVITRYF